MEFHELSSKQLLNRRIKLEAEVKDMMYDIKSGDTSKLNDYREARRDLARVNTILHEKELGIENVKIEKKEIKKQEKKTVKTVKKERKVKKPVEKKDKKSKKDKK